MRRLPLVLLLQSAPLLALPPGNDDWANRIVIDPAALSGPGGYSIVQPSIDEATTVSSDPILVCKNGDPAQRGNSVWYALTLPGGKAQTYYVNMAALGYDSITATYTGDPEGGFRPVLGACNDDGASGLQSSLAGVRLVGGTEYSIMVARPAPNLNAASLGFSARLAPIYTVTKTSDSLDGVCDADCSLREAIAASNATPGAVAIPAGDYMLSRSGADDSNNNGDLDLSAGMGVYGAGVGVTRVIGLAGERLFDLDPANTRGHTFQFRDFRIQGGSPFSFGGAIKSTTPVTPGNDHVALVEMHLFENTTQLAGGGMRADGPTVVFGSTIECNTSGSDGGGLSFGGDANTRVDIGHTTLNCNQSNGASAGGGGGIHSTSNTVIYNSTVSGNRARNNGGGILSTLASGRMTLLNTTVAGNMADSDGSGSGLSGVGGGIRIEGNFASIQNSALFGNTLGSSIPGGIADECSKAPGLTNVILGFNHLQAASSNCGFSPATNDVLGLGALTGPLADNGGGTRTFLPLPGSPLIDSGSNGLCVGDDQRGIARPLDGDGNGTATCDKGAAEAARTNLFADDFENLPM